MGIIRVKRVSHFTHIPNETLRDARLSWAAKGLLAVMLSYPDDWAFNTTHLRSLTPDGTRSTRTAMYELIDHGYVKRQRVQAGWDYEVYETPHGTNPHVPIRHVSNRHVPEKHTTNTERPTKTENNIKKKSPLIEEEARVLADVWNEHCGALPSVKAVSGARRSKLAAFVSDCGSIEDAKDTLRKATLVVAHDDFWLKNKFGLDNLLAGGKVFQRAEQYEAKAEPKLIEVAVGNRVRVWVTTGAQRVIARGEVTEVTDAQVVLRNPMGLEVRVPRRDVIGVDP